MPRGKKILNAKSKVDSDKKYTLNEAINLALELKFTNFDESVDIALNLGVDPRQADQMIRSSVILPHGTGKKVVVLAFAQGEKEKEAKDAGADFVGGDDLIEKIKGGWLDFDKAVATPDMMKSVSKVARILGPRGMMPNPKTGTVTMDIASAINEIKAGKVDFRVEKAGIVHAIIGRVSFGAEKIAQNFMAVYDRIMKLKPASSKGLYVQGISISTSHGPGIRIDANTLK